MRSTWVPEDACGIAQAVSVIGDGWQCPDFRGIERVRARSASLVTMSRKLLIGVSGAYVGVRVDGLFIGRGPIIGIRPAHPSAARFPYSASRFAVGLGAARNAVSASSVAPGASSAG